jgi:hypothetical protein
LSPPPLFFLRHDIIISEKGGGIQDLILIRLIPMLILQINLGKIYFVWQAILPH